MPLLVHFSLPVTANHSIQTSLVVFVMIFVIRENPFRILQVIQIQFKRRRAGMFKKCPVFFLLSSDGVPVDCVPVIMGNVSGPVLFQ